MSEPKRYDLVDKHYGYFLCHKIEGEWVKWEDYASLKAEVKKLTEAGNAMDNAISEIDPQRAERHRFMRMTDAEYLAVMKWRIAKDPNYNRA